MHRPLVAVVLAGGVGTRLYPASRTDRPKQFCAFHGEASLLSKTVERVAFADETCVVTREAFADRVREHAPDAGVLVEPEPKDTGPALVYAAHRLRERYEDPVLLCLPSDHHVAGDFEQSARRAAGVAVETGGLVCLGVEPTRPATEYGYVEPGVDHGEYRAVETFHEKPDAETAARYRDRGYLWNAGIFAWTPEALLSADRDSELAPLVAALDGGTDSEVDPTGDADHPDRADEEDDAYRPPEAAAERGFDAIECVSVDHAILEGAEDVYVVPVGFEWDDLGAWDAFDRVIGDGEDGETAHASRDEDGNVVMGNALSVDAEGCVIATGSDSHVSVVGVDDLLIASFDDRVLVVPKRDAQRVREVVDRLREADT